MLRFRVNAMIVLGACAAAGVLLKLTDLV
jgi:hypothetical protein